MQGEILLNFVMVLMPDDVRRMKAAGLDDLAKAILNGLDTMVAGWQRGCGRIDSEVWDEVLARLNELRAALHEE